MSGEAGLQPVYVRCWCWQVGRCLIDCPTADHERPVPFVDATWKRAAFALMGKADCFACGIRTSASKDGSRPLCTSCRPAPSPREDQTPQ